MNFSPSVSCSQEKEDKDMSSVWHFWKGLLLPINQSTSVLIDWLLDINRIEKRETFYLAAVWVDSGPTISITVANLGPNRNLLNYCAVPKLRLFPFIISVISWCESWMCEWRKWEKIANIFEGRILLLIVNWPFPPSHLLDAKLSKIKKTFNNILREICKNGNWATNWYFLALSVAVNPKYPISSKSWVQFVSWSLPQPTVKVILWSQNEMMIWIWRRNWLDNYLIIIPLFLSPIIML